MYFSAVIQGHNNRTGLLQFKLENSLCIGVFSTAPSQFLHPSSSLPLCLADSFTRQVLWTLLNDVKFGEAVSYKQLADLAGNSRAARAVGGAMRSNPVSPSSPFQPLPAQSCWGMLDLVSSAGSNVIRLNLSALQTGLP